MRKDTEKNSLTVRRERSDIVKLNNERAKKGGGRIGFDYVYLFSALLTVAVAVLSVGLVFYFGYHLVSVFKSDVTYSPAYLMQNLANMASGVGPLTGYDTAGKYASAKSAFATCYIGGMTHPHMQPTYYLIAYNDFKALP